ncbi:hypothetical protein OG496_26850 [Streptomyces sp. NBC_00988]|uniref:hypothetical protein n=1 Tax=Streptomyces sp. NBC_00988 TaxID=2903704 RepID=UPI0038637242|nr:hypothetical protein OG496_26850 [Streptomyces sp. NBC_00988]
MGDVLEVPEESIEEVPDPEPELGPETEPESGPAPRPRRRGRTTLLIAVAAVLGVVAGTCTGFLVQANRAPDALPSLSQATLTQAKGPAPEPLSAAQDREVKVDGDLRKLLLKRPSGARDADYTTGEDGWLDLAGYAEMYDRPANAFPELVANEFRRAAVANWREGSSLFVEIRLVQYRQQDQLVVPDSASSAYTYAENKPHTDSWPIPGTGDGMAYVHNSPDREAGYTDVYNADAHAWRGDIEMEIWVSSGSPVPKKKIMDLAKRQMERL